MLAIPMVKDLAEGMAFAMFAEQMHIMVRAGLNIDRCLELSSSAVGNEVFRRSLLRVRDMVVSGQSISRSLRSESLYPMLVIRMVSIGENSGTLEGQFAFLSELYCGKLDGLSASLSKIVEPVVIILVGAVFMLIILGLLLPVYDLVSSVGKGG
jgi:type II secretory pathway component PulF